MSIIDLPNERPVAVTMFFVGVVLLGLIAWQRMPVELFPALEGDQVTVAFGRSGSEPEIVERDLLMPLEAKVATLPKVSESWGMINGSSGQLRVRFEAGSDVKVRELELRRLAADLQRAQPPGTYINVNSSGTEIFSSFVMTVHVLGQADGDINTLYDLVEQQIAPRFASVAGVSQAQPNGGAGRQVTVTVDPYRAIALGITTDAVTNAVRRNVGRQEFVGGLETEGGRQVVMLDGRPPSIDSLANAKIQPNRAARLRHVSDLAFGTAREESRFRVNGKPAVGLVLFQEQGANLVRLGASLRERLGEVRAEVAPLGIDLVIGFDAAEQIEEQIDRLGKLAGSGFLIALVVLYLFLRQWRAVAVVGIAVPMSLLAALALLFLSGQSINIITLMGLAIAIGLVIDNSVVVFEAVQRRLERGTEITEAVREGLRRTVRAMTAASLTTAVVFLPFQLVDFDSEQMRSMILVVSMSILLPLLASLVVAIGLVPLLAQRLSAPAAVRDLSIRRERRTLRAGTTPPDSIRIFFERVVTSALRRPPSWIAGTLAAVLITTVVALPWLATSSGSSNVSEADTVEMSVQFARGSASINTVSEGMAKLESAVMKLDGVEMVEALIREDEGTLTVHLVEEKLRPPGFRAQDVRSTVRRIDRNDRRMYVLRPGEGGMGDGGKGRGGGGGGGGVEMFSGGPAEVVLSGPDSRELTTLSRSVRSQLESMGPVANAWENYRPGMDEFWIEPREEVIESMGLSVSNLVPALRLAGREGVTMQTGFLLPNGRELPVVVERLNAREADMGIRDLERLRVQTDVGAVPIRALASLRRMPAPRVILHHNGRRETTVNYNFENSVQDTGPTRLAIEEQVVAAMRAVPRPEGFTIETAQQDETSNQLQQVILPVILLLFLVLAMTFESLTLPVLVLLSLPITLLGATWAMVFAGVALGPMAMVGAVALIGLTVNPAILLVDRMQQLVLGAGWSPGAAAYAAVRERTRPVLLTMATTVAGLWPLAIATGREFEIWPPFATIVIGGLITSSLLTLLIVPVGFTLLRRLDLLFGRIGPWLALGWIGVTASVISGFVLTETLTSLLWQVVVALLVGGSLLAVVVMAFRPRDSIQPEFAEGPPKLEVRYLTKSYGLPGALRRSLDAPKHYVKKVLELGGQPFLPVEARERLVPLLLAASGPVYLAIQLESVFWRLAFTMIAATLLSRCVLDIRRARGRTDVRGVVLPGGVENAIARLLPWIGLGLFGWYEFFGIERSEFNELTGGTFSGRILLLIVAALCVSMVGYCRRKATEFNQVGSKIRRRRAWERLAAWLGSFGEPANPMQAISSISFTVERGMVGVLGPNGAGKSTLLRQLAGVLDPTGGTIHLGGAPYHAIQRYLAHWVGYLPQDAGLPTSSTAQEYLSYYAALYDVPRDLRQQRVSELLHEVGLGEKVDAPIGSLSGGMRQRVAVARTLLRLPPVIVVDEPTVGLDPRERIRFRSLLGRLAQDRIVLFSTHVVEDVAAACDRVLVIAEGRLVFDGEPTALAKGAQGYVWEINVPTDETLVLPEGVIRVEENLSAQGTLVRHKVLAESPPDPRATLLDPLLEDGYMWLVASARNRDEIPSPDQGNVASLDPAFAR